MYWPPWQPWYDPASQLPMQPVNPFSMPQNPAMMPFPAMPFAQPAPAQMQLAPPLSTPQGAMAMPATVPAAAAAPPALPLSPSMPADTHLPGPVDPWAAAAAGARLQGLTSAEQESIIGMGRPPASAAPTNPAPVILPNLDTHYANNLSPPPGAWAPGGGRDEPAHNNIFTGRGGKDASKTVTGITAEFLLERTRRNIAD